MHPKGRTVPDVQAVPDSTDQSPPTDNALSPLLVTRWAIVEAGAAGQRTKSAAMSEAASRRHRLRCLLSPERVQPLG